MKLDSAIDANKTRNFFQTNGNHGKYPKRNRPVGGGEGWWWTSGMGGSGEVHGQVDGFDNVPFVASGADDQALHDDICTGKAFKDMLAEASQELANFPV